LEVAKSKGSPFSETVNNRLDETSLDSARTGRAGGVPLSASDSAVLRAIARSDGSSLDSQIDLIHDSSSPNPTRSKSQAISKAADDSRIKPTGPRETHQPINQVLPPDRIHPLTSNPRQRKPHRDSPQQRTIPPMHQRALRKRTLGLQAMHLMSRKMQMNRIRQCPAFGLV